MTASVVIGVTAGVLVLALAVTSRSQYKARQTLANARREHERVMRGLSEQREQYERFVYQRKRGLPESDDSPRLIAKRLLVSHLTKTQQEDFIDSGAFNVVGSDGKTYRVSTVLGDFNVSTPVGITYCTHADARFNCPKYDEILAQVLLLRADAAAFKRIANQSTIGW